jgi:hypothetical protein
MPRESFYASYGVMGGFMQPQGHVQVLSALHDAGLDPQSALDLPRFCIDVDSAGGRVAIEEGMPKKQWMPCKRWDIHCTKSADTNAPCSAGDRLFCEIQRQVCCVLAAIRVQMDAQALCRAGL